MWPESPKVTSAYMSVLSSSRFCLSIVSLTGLVVVLVVHGGEECRAMAEMTLKIVSCV